MEVVTQKESKAGFFYEALEKEVDMRKRDIPSWIAAVFVVIMIAMEIGTRRWFYNLGIDIGIVFGLVYLTGNLSGRIRGIEEDIRGMREDIRNLRK